MKKNLKIMSKRDVSVKFLLFFVGFLLFGATYILILNFKSLKIQRKVKEELESKSMKMTSAYVSESYPWVPNLTVVAEPIGVQKARYFINEKKYEEAYKELIATNSNPFDARREFFLALSFQQQKKHDSAVHYAEKGLKIKPRFYGLSKLLAISYELKNDRSKALEVWKNYVKHTKNNVEPWENIVRLSRVMGDTKGVEMYNDSIRKYFSKKFPKTTKDPDYVKAVRHFGNKNYAEALILYDKFIAKNPNHVQALESRAFCNFLEKKYEKSNQDIRAIEKITGSIELQLINLRGINFYNLKDVNNACKCFKIAKDKGDQDGVFNYNKFCK